MYIFLFHRHFKNEQKGDVNKLAFLSKYSAKAPEIKNYKVKIGEKVNHANDALIQEIKSENYIKIQEKYSGIPEQKSVKDA